LEPQRPEMPILRVERLGKSYAPGQFAIRNVTLEVRAGEFIVVIGRSGAGKSTLLRCLNLLIRPTEGRVELKGVDVTHASGRQLREVRGRVGMIFQGFNLVKRLSVLDNVLCGRLRFRTGPLALVSSVTRWLPGREREIAFECLKRVDIEHLAFRRADTLSGGQQQRVAIARVLAQEPDVILADEPIASLDPKSAENVMRTLRGIQESRGIPVVVNLHQVDIARAFASRLVGMSKGGIRLDARPHEIAPDEVEDLYSSENTRADQSSRAVPGVDSRGVEVSSMRDEPRSTSIAGVSA
jgi:phosphonate transport system ATP-binding protein